MSSQKSNAMRNDPENDRVTAALYAGGVAAVNRHDTLSDRNRRTTMAYANNQGTRIYNEIEGSGSPLIFRHGLSDAMLPI
jgi:hypothetical protein